MPFDNIRTRLRHDDHVTLSLVRSTRDGRLVFSGAHEDLLIWRQDSGRVEQIATVGVWLGTRNDIAAALQETTVQLRDGDVVVLYTDGVTEAMNARRQQWDIPRFKQAIAEAGPRGAAAVRDRVLRLVHEWMHVQDDDITMVVFRCLTR